MTTLELLPIAFVHLVAVASPGPDLALIVRNSLVLSRKHGVWTALGVNLSNSIHILLVALGLGQLVKVYPLSSFIIKLLSAGVLLYLGYLSISKSKNTSALNPQKPKSTKNISPLRCFGLGFLTSFFNVKAIIYFAAIISQLLESQSTLMNKLTLALVLMGVGLVWFNFVAILSSNKKLKLALERKLNYFDQFVGYVFLIFAGLVLMSLNFNF